MPLDREQLAVLYYFGDLQYWKLPRIAADALEEGYDGPALRTLAGLASFSSSDIRAEDIRANEIDSAFCEMGVNAPIAKDQARLVLATESAQKALHGQSNVFDEATHVRIHLCELSEPPESLRRVVSLSKEARNAPRSQWDRIEADLKDAFTDFLRCQKIQLPEWPPALPQRVFGLPWSPEALLWGTLGSGLGGVPQRWAARRKPGLDSPVLLRGMHPADGRGVPHCQTRIRYGTMLCQRNESLSMARMHGAARSGMVLSDAPDAETIAMK